MDTPQAPRGIPTMSPTQAAALSHVQTCIAKRVVSFGYEEVGLPILENQDLFKRAVGENTDIVEKEMYAFDDRNGAHVCLRPEGTAGCIAAALRLGLCTKGQRARVWYSGPFFRRERPQKGRYRQFHQIGVEAIGFDDTAIDVELLMLTMMLWEDLGLANKFELQINTLGDARARETHRKELVAYLTENESRLDDNARQRIHTNPLRVLDSKDLDTQAVVKSAPPLSDYISEESAARYTFIKERLDDAGIAYTENPRLVRGLDYYTDLVFEWTTPSAAGQNTVCAGGRYDGLVSQLGGDETPAAGFAVGIERVAALLEDDNGNGSGNGKDIGRPPLSPLPPLMYAIALSEPATAAQTRLLLEMRRRLPNWICVADGIGGSLKAQLKRADKHGATVALLVGDDEMANNEVTLRRLADGEQRSVATGKLADALKDMVAAVATNAGRVVE